MIIEKLFPSLNDDEKKNLNRLYRRQCMVQSYWEHMSGQAKGIVYALMPFLEDLYKDDHEALKEAYQRHFKYFNSTPHLGSYVVGLTYALEKEKAIQKTVTDEAITSVKISLCGPLAGIGDPLMQNIIKMIIAGLTMGLAAKGNPLGAILFALLYSSIQIFVMKYTTFLGYSNGTSFVTKLFESGLITIVTKAINVLGLVMIGAMVASNVNFQFKWLIELGGVSLDVQSTLDSIFPGLMSVILTFGVYGLIKRKVKVSFIVYSIMAVCLLLAFLGLV